MLKKRPFARVLLTCAIFLSPLFALSFEGKAKIEGYYLDNPVKTATNKRDAYVNLVRKLREAVKINMNMAYPNPSNPGKTFFVDDTIYFFGINFLYFVEPHTCTKLKQLKGIESKWTKVKIKRKNFYSDLFYFSAQSCSKDNNMSKITGLVKVVPVIPVPIHDVRKGLEIKLDNLTYQTVSWEFLRSSIKSFEGLAISKNSLKELKSESELLAGEPIYSEKLKKRAIGKATLLRLYGY
jgi:hypothetical protein